MNTPYRLLIVDSDVSYSDYLRECLNKSGRLKVVGVANGGAAALNMIQSEKPDILLIDPILTEIDGLTLISNIRSIQPSILSIVCISHFYSEIILELAKRSGVDYYLYKPIHIESLISVLVHCADIASEISRSKNAHQELHSSNIIHRITHEIMIELGFSTKLSGSRYLEESIALVHESPMLLHNIHSGLYAYLAARDQTTPSNIERCIRTAITAANANGELSRRINGTPTNKTCIRYLLSLFIERFQLNS